MDKFPDLFPKKATSIIIVDLSANLKIIDITLKGEIRINALGIFSLPQEKTEEFILNTLLNFLKEKGIQHKDVILSPPLSSLVIKRLQLPEMPQEELPEAIKWHIKEEVPFDLQQAVLGFQIIKKTTKEDGTKSLEIKCVAAKTEEIRKQVLLLRQAGLNCLAVIPLTFGYAKFIERYLHEDQSKNIGIVFLVEENCYFIVYRDGKMEFYREIPISINKLKEAMSVVLVSDKGKIQLTEAEINEILFKIGLPMDDKFVYQDKISANQIISLMRPSLERLNLEIKRSLSYYDAQFHGGSLEKLWLTGLAAQIKNLDKFLSKELALEISSFSLRDKIATAKDIHPEQLLQSYAAFGLIFDYQSSINLLPQEFRSEKIEKVQKFSLRWTIFFAFLSLAVAYLFARVAIGAYQRRLDNASLQLNTILEIKSTRAEVEDFSAFLKNVKNQEAPIGTILKKLSNLGPRQLFIENFSINCIAKTGVINGYVKSTDLNPDTILTKFSTDIDDAGIFKESTISKVEKTNLEGQEAVVFQLNFDLP